MSLADEELYIPAPGSRFVEARSFVWNLVSTRSTQFGYFDDLLGHPEWKGRKILDFGGNVGTFLVGAGNRVNHDEYWCLDLNREVVDQGQRTYPRAHFVHYNRYSSQYNPNGVRYLPIPDIGIKFDIILAFSVFTHIDQSEMLELVGSLRNMLAPEGVLAFTFWDPHSDMSLSDPCHRSPGAKPRSGLISRKYSSQPESLSQSATARASALFPLEWLMKMVAMCSCEGDAPRCSCYRRSTSVTSGRSQRLEAGHSAVAVRDGNRIYLDLVRKAAPM